MDVNQRVYPGFLARSRKSQPDQICERDQAIALLPWLLTTYTVKQAHREIVSPITTQADTNHCRYSQSCMAKTQVY